MKSKRSKTLLDAFDALIGELTQHKHRWTPKQRRLYNRMVALLEKES